MDSITIDGLTFSVELEHDHSHGAPWEEECGHGPVSAWTRRDKRPGERVLHSDGLSRIYYDVAGATRIARRDGWGISPDRLDAWRERVGQKLTRGQIVAAAVESDFQRLRAWCNNEWSYVVVTVTLLDTDGDETWMYECIGGVESDADEHIGDIAQGLAEQIAGEIGDATHIEHGAKRVQVREV